MYQLTTTSHFDHNRAIFKPVSTALIDTMLARYSSDKEGLLHFHSLISDPNNKNAISYFLREAGEEIRSGSINISDLETASKFLDADYWQRTLQETDVLELMPQQRRDEWYDSIRSRTTPTFERETVISTLTDLLLSRDLFFAERVDGMFKRLSGKHVTNAPQGFRKRMIMSSVLDKFHWVESSATGYIHDLRCVIAKLVSREEPVYNDSYRVLNNGKAQFGEWASIDGGAIKIKLFKVGTAHIEIHPDVANKLNDVLAFLYPMAIPPEFRRKPEKKYKEFDFTKQLIPHSVLRIISSMECKREIDEDTGDLKLIHQFQYMADQDKHLREKAEAILIACGGVKISPSRFEFGYDFAEVKRHLVSDGTIPDQKAHQFYPTNTTLAQEIVDWCDIEPHHSCLEPEAGQGGIATLMPKSTTCVEISDLHCKILKAVGMTSVVCGDFIKWAETAPLFDRICMNPPFSQGRAEQHFTVAAKLLKEGGKLTAILPVSMKNKPKMAGFDYEWSSPKSNEFDGVSIDVITVKITRRMYA